MSKFNPGIALVKTLACLCVVEMHFGQSLGGYRLAVPSFMFLAFYLSDSMFAKGDRQCLFARIRRLFVPFAACGVIGILDAYFRGGQLSAMDVALQLTIGYPYSGHMWYMVVLMIFTIVLFYIAQRDVNTRMVVYCVLVAGCFALEYTGLNYRVFSLISHIGRHTPARLVEYLPFAISGLVFAKVIKTCGDMFRIVVILLTILAISICLWFLKIPGQPLGFGGQGIAPYLMVVSICPLAIIMGKALSGKVAWCDWALKTVGSLTAGVYFYHVVVGNACRDLLGLKNSHILALIVFVVTSVIVFLVGRVKYIKWIVR